MEIYVKYMLNIILLNIYVYKYLNFNFMTK